MGLREWFFKDFLNAFAQGVLLELRLNVGGQEVELRHLNRFSRLLIYFVDKRLDFFDGLKSIQPWHLEIS